MCLSPWGKRQLRIEFRYLCIHQVLSPDICDGREWVTFLLRM